jgi:RHS repeat-associated protein
MRDGLAGANRYYHFDHQGTTQCLTDGTGAVTDRFASDAWGVQVKRTGSSINRYWYVGGSGYYQQISGYVYYVRARYYAALNGRWRAVDVMRVPSGRYVYADNEASLRIDPSGLQPPDNRPPAPPNPPDPCVVPCGAFAGELQYEAASAQRDVLPLCNPCLPKNINDILDRLAWIDRYLADLLRDCRRRYVGPGRAACREGNPYHCPKPPFDGRTYYPKGWPEASQCTFLCMMRHEFSHGPLDPNDPQNACKVECRAFLGEIQCLVETLQRVTPANCCGLDPMLLEDAKAAAGAYAGRYRDLRKACFDKGAVVD